MLRVIGLSALLFASGAQAQEEGRKTVAKEERDLVVVADLSTHGVDKFKWLYRFIEANAVGMAQRNLGDSYRQILALTGENATLAGFHQGLASLAESATSPRAVDVFVNLHGAPGALWFHEGAYGTSEIKDALATHDALTPKLRLLYSTACYGDSHAEDFLAAGFQVASGSLKVNSNSPFDYPTTMNAWKAGDPFASAQEKGNNEVWRKFYDGIAKNQGFEDADSTKIVHGDKALTIDQTR